MRPAGNDDDPRDAVFWTSEVVERNRRRLLKVWGEEPQRGGLQDDVNGNECCPS